MKWERSDQKFPVFWNRFCLINIWQFILQFVQIFTGQIRDLINQYLIEANSGQYDYVKALAEFSSKDESALTFKKGEIIAVVPKHDAYTEKVKINEKSSTEFWTKNLNSNEKTKK